MADDEAPDWFSAADDETETPAADSTPAAADAAPGGGGEAAPEGGETGGEGGGEGGGEEKREVAEDEYLDPNKLILFKHWKRPKFLQYKYLYDYRHNYYDDVIDYLDKRAHGIKREIPRPQTWAERTLRTFKTQTHAEELQKKLKADVNLVERSISSGNLFRLHMKDSINSRYSKLLY